jgi:hypothetical protein
MNPRSFSMGFTPFPFDGGTDGLRFSFETIRTTGDLVVMHFDNGIPWDAALLNDSGSYPADLKSELDRFRAFFPAGHKRYLAITPIAFTRDRLAPSRGENGTTSFESPWDTLPYDHPDVIRAYVNHCRFLVGKLQPDYFAYAIESNILREQQPDSVWNHFALFSHAIYDSLKRTFPGLPLFQTLQSGSVYRNPAVQTSAIAQIMEVNDVVAVSAYPYGDYEYYQDQSQANPALLPSDYFAGIAGLSPGKPFAIAETGWPSEDIVAPYPITIHSNSQFQRDYVSRLLLAADDLHALFICWYLPRDYDAFWESSLRTRPDSALVRLWKDIGLYEGNGDPKPALNTWKQYLARPRS